MALPKSPVNHNFTAYRGQPWNQNLRCKKAGEVMDLTGYTAEMQIRPSENSARLTAQVHAEVTGVDGLISLALTQDETAGIVPGIYVYDLKMINPKGIARYWMIGKFSIKGRVTA